MLAGPACPNRALALPCVITESNQYGELLRGGEYNAERPYSSLRYRRRESLRDEFRHCGRLWVRPKKRWGRYLGTFSSQIICVSHSDRKPNPLLTNPASQSWTIFSGLGHRQD